MKTHVNVVEIVNAINKMINENKAIIYDNCLRESDQLQRENSKIKSAFAGNIPPEQQLIIDKNNQRIDYLVKKLEIKKPNFIEIGIQDYSESNTRFLYEQYYSSGLVIDSQINLRENVLISGLNLWKGDLRIVEKFVSSKNIKEVILENCDFNVDIFSIDIDGIDYWVLNNLPDTIKPKIIIVEYNSIFGHDLEVTVPDIDNFSRDSYHFSNLCYGASLKAYVNLMKFKGYYFLGVNRLRNNAFFISNNYSKETYFPNIKKLSMEECTNSLFRESRSLDGNLNYLSAKDRKKQIYECELIDLSKNIFSKIRFKDLLN
jgi:hypothetical protein